MTDHEITERRAAQVVFAHLRVIRQEEIARLTAIRDALRAKVAEGGGEPWSVEVVP